VTLSASDLPHRVRIQTPSSYASDGGGGQRVTWADLATVWAAITPGAGREFMAAQQLQPDLTHSVTIRYRIGVTPKQRLLCKTGGRTRSFTVHSVVDVDEAHEQLMLLCSEIVPT
jgi:SPP1 family predicted phage head-tail adaptor